MSLFTTTLNASTAFIGTSLSPTTVESGMDSKRVVLLIVSAVILVLSVISGVIGNVLVCVSVYRNRNLRTANNALLVNLAVGDLVVCFTSIPIMLAELFNNYSDQCTPFGDIVCSTQTFFHITSSSVQLITLVAISVERYEAIVHPFETKKKRRRVIVGISVSWIMAVVIAVPASVLLNKSSLYLLCACRLGERPHDYLHIIIIAPLGVGCLVCVVLFYLRIFRTVRKHVKKKHKSPKNDTGTNNTTSSRLWKSLRSRCCRCCRTNVVGDIPVAPEQPTATTDPPVQNATEKPSNSGVQILQIDTKNKNEDGFEGSPDSSTSPLKNPQERRLVSNRTDVGELPGRSITPDTGVGSYGMPQENIDREQNGGVAVANPEEGPAGNTLQPKGMLIAITPASPSCIIPAGEENASMPALSNRRASEQVTDASSRRKPEDIKGSVCVLNPEMRVRGRRNLEAKTAKRASYIIGVFSLCWLPLFVVSYVDSMTEVDILMACIAAMSAALNPIVYTVVNKSFRTEFVKISRSLTKCCPERCRWLHKP